MAVVSVTGFSQLVMTDMVSNRGLYLSLFNPMRSYQQYGSIGCFARSIKLSVPENQWIQFEKSRRDYFKIYF